MKHFSKWCNTDREDLASGRVRWTDLTPAEWRDCDDRAITEQQGDRRLPPYEKEYFRKDGSRVPVLLGGALFEGVGTKVWPSIRFEQAKASTRELCGAARHSSRKANVSVK